MAKTRREIKDVQFDWRDVTSAVKAWCRVSNKSRVTGRNRMESAEDLRLR